MRPSLSMVRLSPVNPDMSPIDPDGSFEVEVTAGTIRLLVRSGPASVLTPWFAV